MSDKDVLDLYQEFRAAHPHMAWRDRLASSLGNTALRLATREYRALCHDSIRLGLLAIASRRNPPFYEPLDDEAARP